LPETNARLADYRDADDDAVSSNHADSSMRWSFHRGDQSVPDNWLNIAISLIDRGGK
jgi:hypothetical protein